ncbi:MAG: tRNA-binding protein [Thermoplasmata archaeon]
MTESPFDVTIKVGEVKKAEEFSEARKPNMCKLWIDLGDREVQSAAQLLYHHDVDRLKGKQVLCATDLGEVNIAGFKSEVLTVGVPDEDGHPVLVTPEKEVPLGGILY